MDQPEPQESTLVASEKSTHFVETFILEKENIKKHPDADLLSILKIGSTDYTYVGRTADWTDKVGSLCVWIPPDSLCDVKRPEFSFLGEKGSRIKGRKLRGVSSYGIVIPAPDGIKLGENEAATKLLGIEHYEPEATGARNSKTNSPKLYVMSGETSKAPKGVYPKYDVDSFLKYGRRFFKEGEMVYISEKCDGSNSRFVHQDGEMHCGSREEWKREWTQAPKITLEELTVNLSSKITDPEEASKKAKEIYERAVVNFKSKKSMWWMALEGVPGLRKFCEEHPGWCVYGEVFGSGRIKYFNDGKPYFRAFDILVPSDFEAGCGRQKWISSREFIKYCDDYQIPRVPEIGFMPFEFDKVVALAEGKSLIPGTDCIREGCVIKPEFERPTDRFGRLMLKIISPVYLEKY